MANLAEALVLADQSRLEHEAAILLDRVLVLDTDNPKALWYGGLLADARGETELARTRWERLLRMDPPAEFRVILERRLASVGGARGFALEVGVSIAERLAAGGTGGGTLFITLHAVDAAGPPVAAMRMPVPVFPVSVTMTEAAAMMGDTAALRGNAFRVVARISASGDARRQAGDLVGTAQWRQEEGSRVEVRIDREITEDDDADG
jgi:cytochrome c-type biogenesis protein CcmH